MASKADELFPPIDEAKWDMGELERLASLPKAESIDLFKEYERRIRKLKNERHRLSENAKVAEKLAGAQAATIEALHEMIELRSVPNG